MAISLKTELGQLKKLVSKYNSQKAKGLLNNTSEEDIRGWIDKLLAVFGWDTTDPSQVKKEAVLSKAERAKLASIGSRHSRPDYTLKNNETRLCFVDAKNICDDIFTNDSYAFQIRSYGYSINADISILTNFEQIAVYDTRVKPLLTDSAQICREAIFLIDEYESRFSELKKYLGRTAILNGIKLNARSATPIDKEFANELRKVRLEIGQAIAAGSPSPLPRHDLNFLTQTIINRILFIRVCEARGLEKDGILTDFEKIDFWKCFSESSYGDFYKKYDGPLFKKSDALKDITVSNGAFSSFIKKLYYPSPYCFDVISLKSISDIYDLFLGYQLDYSSTGGICDTKKIDVPKSGSVTTPKSVVDRVIASTLKISDMKKMSIEDLLKIKVLDPACGSGSFLISAFEAFEGIVKEHNKRFFAKKSHGYCKSHGRGLLDINGRKDIIFNCLYGVDISREAVEVAKLSLCLKLFDGYDAEDYNKVGLRGDQILNGIGDNIKCGNTLVASDILNDYPNLRTNTDEVVATNIMDWDAQFPHICTQSRGFDYIIGNPPYVEVKNYNVLLPTMSQYIKTKYSTCSSGKIDLSMPFIEKAISLLSPTGRLGFITQKRFFVADYGDDLRNHLSKNHYVSEIFDYDNQTVFKGLNTYVCILVCDKKGTNKSSFSYTNLTTDEQWAIRYKDIEDDIWSFKYYPLYKISKSLRKRLGTLEGACNILDGIQVLWKDAYQIAPEKIEAGFIHGSTKLSDTVCVEEASCRPIIRNDAYYPFIVPQPDMYAIFPYDIVNGDKQDIQFSDFCKRFPEAGKYLSKYKSDIERNVETVPKRSKSKSPVEDWHLYTRCSHLGKIGPKICVPVVALEPEAGIVKNNNVYADNSNVYFLTVDGDDLDKMYALSSIINSTAFAALAKITALPQSNGYWKYNKQALKDIPFPKKAFDAFGSEFQRLAELGKEIESTLENKKALGSLGDRLNPVLTRDWQEIDSIVNQIYRLTKDEIKQLNQTERRDRDEG